MNTSFGISGVFAGASDSFDRTRHTVNINASTGAKLREAAKSVRTEKTEAAVPGPYIAEAADVITGAVNSTLTAGGILRLTGSRLKFDAADAEQGVWLVSEAGGAAVKCAAVAENKPARLMVMVPQDIASGTYYAEVRTKLLGNGTSGKTQRTGRFAKPLEVHAQA